MSNIKPASKDDPIFNTPLTTSTVRTGKNGVTPRYTNVIETIPDGIKIEDFVSHNPYVYNVFAGQALERFNRENKDGQLEARLKASGEAFRARVSAKDDTQ